MYGAYQQRALVSPDANICGANERVHLGPHRCPVSEKDHHLMTLRKTVRED